MSTGEKTRVDWVDIAKGVCIIFVVMMHSVLGVENEAGARGWMHWIVAFAQPFRMPDFFLISGLFLGLVIDRSWLRYTDRKIVHFAYFYVLWLTIQFLFKAHGIVGAHSIVVYLAFFLPMAIARTILLKSGMIADIGTISLLTVTSGVLGPVILYGVIQWSGYGQFLFKRPQWAHIDRVPAPREALASAEQPS